MTSLSRWDLGSVERPWRGAPSIYDHIRSHIAPGVTGLLDGGERLPDARPGDTASAWVAGGIDSSFARHGGGGGAEPSRVRMLHRAFVVALDDATSPKLAALYHQLVPNDVIDFIDPLLAELRGHRDPARLRELAVWLATGAPERAPVKVAIALLGLVSADVESDELLVTLGRHDEFTLYVAVAIANRGGPDAERRLFELAHHVMGWGRVEVVERLAGTTDPTIRHWMLRDGYKSNVGYERLAHTCATTGGLRDALAADRVDAVLLAGAGHLLQGLLQGGSAKSLDDYDDGAVVVERYLHHVGAEPRQLEQLLVLHVIDEFLESCAADVPRRAAREQRGWNPMRRATLRAKIAAVKALPHWAEIVAAGLGATDWGTFDEASWAAKALGIDAWEQHFDRLASKNFHWWHDVMCTDEPARIARVAERAESLLALDAIASGPAEENGYGPQWTDHGLLRVVVLKLPPRIGWPLIRAALRSPVIQGREVALRTLSEWGKECWPDGAEAFLETAAREEPVEAVRALIGKVLAGERLVLEEP